MYPTSLPKITVERSAELVGSYVLSEPPVETVELAHGVMDIAYSIAITGVDREKVSYFRESPEKDRYIEAMKWFNYGSLRTECTYDNHGDGIELEEEWQKILYELTAICNKALEGHFVRWGKVIKIQDDEING